MPGLHSKEPGQVVVAVDTSGSIDDRLLARFGAEASGLLEDYDTTIHVIYCDTKVQGVQSFERQDLPLKLNPPGRRRHGFPAGVRLGCSAGFGTLLPGLSDRSGMQPVSRPATGISGTVALYRCSQAQYTLRPGG